MANIIQLEKITACKINTEDYKKTNDDYKQESLKETYESLTGLKSENNINYLIDNGCLYLIPQSTKGFQQDLENLWDIFLTL